MKRILLASKSDIKKASVAAYFTNILKKTHIIDTCDTSICGLPAQPIRKGPVDGIVHCASKRLEHAIQHSNGFHDYIISIENGIDLDYKREICVVVIRYNGLTSYGEYGLSFSKTLVEPYLEKLCAFDGLNTFGTNKTLGELIHDSDTDIPANNWTLPILKCDRIDQILVAMGNSHKELTEKHAINDTFRLYLNWPKEGVKFQYLFPLFTNPDLTKKAVILMGKPFFNMKIDYIVGLESRGYILGILLQQELNCPFVPAAKPGKIPGHSVERTYNKEYGTDKLVMAKDSIKPGSRVLVVDDLVATGNSLQAVVDMIKNDFGSEVVGCSVLKDVKELRDVVKKNLSVACHVVLI